jgi:hypothetical protein
LKTIDSGKKREVWPQHGIANWHPTDPSKDRHFGGSVLTGNAINLQNRKMRRNCTIPNKGAVFASFSRRTYIFSSAAFNEKELYYALFSDNS